MIERDGVQVPAAQALRVLHVGDSMAPLVGNYLRSIFRRSGRKYDIVAVTSGHSREIANGHTLLDATYRFDPDLILISLGSNELFERDPEDLAWAIDQIVKDTRGRPCLWIGPPAWANDFGYLDMVRRHVGHCRYFASEKLRFERQADGRHPTWASSYRWASAVWKDLGGTTDVPER